MKTPTFDQEQAVELLQSFHLVSGLGVTLLVPDDEAKTVEVLYTDGACYGRCPHCIAKDAADLELWVPTCQREHCKAAVFADRFGGRYFYQCVEDRIFFAAPVVADGGLAAAMLIGPVHIYEVETSRIEGRDLRPFPVRTPAYIEYLSNLLAASAVSVSDSSQSYLRLVKQTSMEQQREIHSAISRRKETEVVEYPIELEASLAHAVEEADAASARALLSEVIGALMASKYVTNIHSLADRAREIMVVVSRAALGAGASSNAVFDALRAYQGELSRLRTNEQVGSCLQRFVEQMVFLVTRLRDVSFEDDSYRAIEYIRAHYNRRLTLEEVASEVGFSPSYFSRLFKKKTGVNFSVYLTQVRVEASKNSLLATDLTISKIAQLSGFDDVSYFNRAFKRAVGVTPGYYRSHRGQIDKSKAFGTE